MRRTISVVVATLALLAASAIHAAAAQQIYWANADGDSIGTAQLDGTGANQAFVRAFGGRPTGVAADGRYVYWTNHDRNTIGRANLDGTGVDQNFITQASQPSAIAVDSGSIYWINHNPAGGSYSVGRADLDGGNAIRSFLPAQAGGGIAVDSTYVYWTGSTTIWRARKDRTSINPAFITGLVRPTGVAAGRNYLYWSDAGDNSAPAIGRAKIDGTGVERQWIRSETGAGGVALSPGRLYWSTSADALARATTGAADIDMSFVTGAAGPVGIAVSPPPGVARPKALPRPPRAAAVCAQSPGGGLTLANVGAAGSRLLVVGSDGLVAGGSGPDGLAESPTPVSHALRGAVWTGARWVVVGDGGTVLSSPDGLTWQQAGGIPASGLRAIAARPGLVVAAGSAGTVLTSEDGLSWSAQNLGADRILWGATAVGSKVLLSGNDATVLASDDGTSWTPVPTSPDDTGNPFESRPLLWQLATDGTTVAAAGDFGAVLAGDLAGLEAQLSNSDETLRGIAYGGGMWVAVGTGGTILRSPFAAHSIWLPVVSPTTVDLRGVAYTGSGFVAVGDQSTVISTDSADAVDWHIDESAMPCALMSVAYGAGRYVAVGGSGRVLFSDDGVTWRAGRQPASEDFYGVTYGPAGWVAVGAGGITLTSADGANWLTGPRPTKQDLRAVTWTGSSYMAGGDGGVLYQSTDAVRWQKMPAGSYSIRDFATAGATTVVVGAGTVVRVSTRRVPESPQAVGFARFQTSVAAGAGRFVIVGHNGEALVSTDDGRTWTPGVTGVDINLDSVVFVGGRFIATGEGRALASPDGLHWNPINLPTARSIRSIAVVGSQLIAVGDGGVVLRSTNGGANWTVIAG